MRIAIIDPLGIPYGPATLFHRGLGGSESAVINISKELRDLGHTVHVYNNCQVDVPYCEMGNDYFPIIEVETPHSKYYDYMIASRSLSPFAPAEHRYMFTRGVVPNYDKIQSISKYKVLWLHDTFVDGDPLLESYVMHGLVHQIFTLSDWHTSYILNCQHGRRRNFEVLKNSIYQTRNGIWEEPNYPVDISKKDHNLFVYNSSVSKGMVPLVQRIWPQVKARIPNARLVIIGGYYRLASTEPADEQEQKYRQLRDNNRDPSITFTGIISQREIYRWLERAGFMIYPAAFPETFGISTLEALSRNTPIITCQFGALEETAIDDASYKIAYAIEPNNLFPEIETEHQIRLFVDLVFQAWSNRYLHQQKMNACNKLRGLISWDTVALQWEYHLTRTMNEFVDVDTYRKFRILENKLANIFNRRFINPTSKFLASGISSVTAPREIVVITTVRNGQDYIERCILSVAQQDYGNYQMFVIDDASTDDTVDVIKKTIDSLSDSIDHKIHWMSNKTRQGALKNQIDQIRALENSDIVILLDGDDFLVSDPTIFSYYNQLYDEVGEWSGGGYYTNIMTYGSCWSMADRIPLYAQHYPEVVKQTKSYKEHKFPWNMPYTHLRTFHAGAILENMNDDSFLVDGKWPMAGGDAVMFYFLLEHIEPECVIPVSDITMIYNDLNPNNDYKVNSEEQTRVANHVLGVKNENKGPNRNSYRPVRRTTNF